MKLGVKKFHRGGGEKFSPNIELIEEVPDQIEEKNINNREATKSFLVEEKREEKAAEQPAYREEKREEAPSLTPVQRLGNLKRIPRDFKSFGELLLIMCGLGIQKPEELVKRYGHGNVVDAIECLSEGIRGGDLVECGIEAKLIQLLDWRVHVEGLISGDQSLA